MHINTDYCISVFLRFLAVQSQNFRTASEFPQAGTDKDEPLQLDSTSTSENTTWYDCNDRTPASESDYDELELTASHDSNPLPLPVIPSGKSVANNYYLHREDNVMSGVVSSVGIGRSYTLNVKESVVRRAGAQEGNILLSWKI